MNCKPVITSPSRSASAYPLSLPLTHREKEKEKDRVCLNSSSPPSPSPSPSSHPQPHPHPPLTPAPHPPPFPPLLTRHKIPENRLQALIAPGQQQHILDADDGPLGVFGERLEIGGCVFDLGPDELGQAGDELRRGGRVEV